MHQKLYEHAQSQMPLLNIHPPVKSSDIPDVPLSIIPEEGRWGSSLTVVIHCVHLFRLILVLLTIWYFVLLTAYQPVTAFNSHLPTSTPALSPQQAVSPSVVHPVSSTLHLLEVN